MNTYDELRKAKIEEARLHFERGAQLLKEAENGFDPEICAQVDKYMELPYTITVEESPKFHCYFSYAAEFEGAKAMGHSHQAAYDHMLYVIRHRIKEAIETGKEVPVPKKID